MPARVVERVEDRLRAKLTDVRLGTATGNADSASIPISVGGSQLGVVPMMLNNGGTAMSALETQHGCGALGGFAIGCKKRRPARTRCPRPRWSPTCAGSGR
ncbi:hypothetical protein AB0F15_40015 [Amycolatopsis sp. NPDC026612]|uniref:hypothetical protein n=1 Tax=Amycolatopsis sp. NPDC026612 TaxID=3155466 RepID=UPI0034097C32